jgi:hypothetical protein
MCHGKLSKSRLGHWKDCGICGTPSWDREDRDRALRGAGIGERVRKAPDDGSPWRLLKL